MQSKEINKIFALLYEIKKRITIIEQSIKTENEQIDDDKNNNGDFTRGSSLW